MEGFETSEGVGIKRMGLTLLIAVSASEQHQSESLPKYIRYILRLDVESQTCLSNAAALHKMERDHPARSIHSFRA